MTIIQVTAVEQPTKGAEYLRVFGTRVGHPQRVVMVALTLRDAQNLITAGTAEGKFPEIEIPDERWISCTEFLGNPKVIVYKEAVK